MQGSGVCWIDSSRSRFNPRKANGRMEEMLLPSRVSLRRTRSPANASPFITGKLFFVSDSSSTVSGSCCVGMSSRPPVLQSTCNGSHVSFRGSARCSKSWFHFRVRRLSSVSFKNRTNMYAQHFLRPLFFQSLFSNAMRHLFKKKNRILMKLSNYVTECCFLPVSVKGKCILADSPDFSS